MCSDACAFACSQLNKLHALERESDWDCNSRLQGKFSWAPHALDLCTIQVDLIEKTFNILDERMWKVKEVDAHFY